MALPRVSFGLIVLNGDPFLRYNLRALYPFAHEILIVEGACRFAASIATSDGHSTDSTLEIIRVFQEQEDPQKKIHLIQRNGFWEEKDQQSQAYAERATGDYLWQVDVDEFYQPEDMLAILEMLERDPQITAASFPQITFWGGFDWSCDSYNLRRGYGIYHRLFRWGPGYRYTSHRPPTVVDPNGRDLRAVNWISGERLRRSGIFLYHYSLVFPKQVREKCAYYKNVDWVDRSKAEDWAEQNFMKLNRPYRVHNVYDSVSWLEHFQGEHPPAIEELRNDIRIGKVKIELRPTEDIEKLLRSPRYRLGRFILKLWDPVDHFLIPHLRSNLYLLRLPFRIFGMLQQKTARRLRHRS